MNEIERLLDRLDIIVHETDLPRGYRGTVNKNGPGYIIFISRSLSEKSKYRTLCHELLHILLGHLDERFEMTEDQKEAQVDRCLSSWAPNF